ncbi:MAG: c-type cytochrome [Cyanobacteriota bacterium]|nr:c-type cytochrome [Cyanobacteriota bacterium]
MKINHIFTALTLVSFLFILTFPSPVRADNLQVGAKIFSQQCAGCHAKGGNIVRRGKNLKKRALARNGYDTALAISNLVTQGKGNMPAYQDRLTETEIQAVSDYVVQQAEKNWKS